ncbi:hypothetical protein [Streptococcus sp. E17BB]|uniref:hypothetical protein n=1 Tax=Streptococcus sp. E17BB TaxID=3278714 RepID=UPI00359CF6CB
MAVIILAVNFAMVYFSYAFLSGLPLEIRAILSVIFTGVLLIVSILIKASREIIVELRRMK